MKLLNSIAAVSLITGAGLLFSFNQNKVEVLNKYHATSPKSTGGGPAGRTGAPGEMSCTACHSGAVQDGNQGANVLQLAGGGTEYLPETMNSFTLTFNQAASKNGFQVVALNASNQMAGAFEITAPTHTQIVTSTPLSRSYVTHTSAGTALSSWSFDWFGPAVGGNVTFYVATNKTNSNSGSSGDVIYTSSHVFTAPDFTGLSEVQQQSDAFSVGYIPSSNQLLLDFELTAFSDITVNVVDLQGRSVQFERIGARTPGSYSEKVQLNSLPKGIYSVSLFIGNRPMTKKVII
jgi:hypothetical protein